MRVLDSIVHVTEDGSWPGNGQCDASEKRLLAEMEQGDVERACLVAVSGIVSNEFVHEVCHRHPGRFWPIGGANPAEWSDDQAVRAAVQSLREAGFVGMKLHPRANQYDPLDPRCVAAIRIAGELGMVVFLDTLFRQFLVPVRHPVDVIDRLSHECPQTRILLLHGAGSALLEVYEVVCRRPNLTLDLSFTLMRYAGSSIDQDLRFLCRVFDQRMTFGSDFPEFTPEQAQRRLKTLMDGISAEKQSNILYRNLDQLMSGGSV